MKNKPFIVGTALLFSSALFLHFETFYGAEATTSGKYKMTYEVDGKTETAIVEVKENQTELLLKDVTIEQNERWSPLDNVVSLKDKTGAPLNINEVTIKTNVNNQEVGMYFVKFSYENYSSVAKVSVSHLSKPSRKNRKTNQINYYEPDEKQTKIILNDELMNNEPAKKRMDETISGGAESGSAGFGSMLSFLSGTLLYGTRRV